MYKIIGTVHKFMKNKDLNDTYICKIGILFRNNFTFTGGEIHRIT